ncbi:hypothetical protein GYMLUDRAFT_248778 [Collybiopsis luxurians FD-317 M1]|uniref:F-box domain-containing protein n=1 Tax=Collybiopsis luxurians FD-317 M1 TaxID=944289 RepID=A0A0D0BKT7_9AGAR|nr:hypothetical protein GYMLUDRAFT_248778 [Collybiopsis luxurians FD-317 M1]
MFAYPTPTSLLRFCEDILLKLPSMEVFVYNVISPNLIQNISQLSYLSSLKLYFRIASRDITGVEILSCVSNLRLESFRLYFLSEAAEDHSLATICLPLATISHLKNFVTNSWLVVCGLASQKIIPQLQPLSAQKVEDLLLLYKLLHRIPTLVDLELDHVRWPEDAENPAAVLLGSPAQEAVKPSLSLSLFPVLRRLSIPLPLVYVFTGPHSLRQIELEGNWGVSDIEVADPRSLHSLQLSPDMKLFFCSSMPSR